MPQGGGASTTGRRGQCHRGGGASATGKKRAMPQGGGGNATGKRGQCHREEGAVTQGRGGSAAWGMTRCAMEMQALSRVSKNEGAGSKQAVQRTYIHTHAITCSL